MCRFVHLVIPPPSEVVGNTFPGMYLHGGAFIVLEGVHNSGKGEQAALLSKYIQQELKRDVMHVRFPDYSTPVGKVLRKHLDHNTQFVDEKKLHLQFVRNRWERRTEILRALQAGENIVCERYVYSGWVYATAAGLDQRWCIKINGGLPEPDLILYLRYPNTNLEDGFGPEIYAEDELQAEAGRIYDKISFPRWKTIDATGKPLQVHARIREVVDAHLFKKKKKKQQQQQQQHY